MSNEDMIEFLLMLEEHGFGNFVGITLWNDGSGNVHYFFEGEETPLASFSSLEELQIIYDLWTLELSKEILENRSGIVIAYLSKDKVKLMTI